MRRSTTRLGAGLLALVLGLAACGGSPTASGPASDNGSGGGAGASSAAEALYAEVGALSGKQRRDRLVAEAEKEGRLDLYTSMTSDIADAVVQAFEDTFDVTVSLYRAGSETVLQKVLQEQKANFAGNDIVETNAHRAVRTRQGGPARRVQGRAPRARAGRRQVRGLDGHAVQPVRP